MNSTAPLNMVKLSSTYRLPGDWNGMSVGAAVNWQSDIWRGAYRPDGSLQNITQKSYTVVDLMARYAFDKHVSATLNVRNLLDQKYYENVGFYNGVFWGDPRSLSLGMEWML